VGRPSLGRMDLDPRAAIDDLAGRLDDARSFLDLDGLESELAELREQAADPGLWDDQDRAKTVTTRLARVEGTIDRVSGLEAALEDAETLLELLKEEGEDVDEITAELSRIDKDLSALELESLFFEEYDDHDAIVNINAGAGGVDAQDWAEILLRAYLRFAEQQGFGVRVEEIHEGEQAGIKSASISVKGDRAYGTFISEKGVHRLVRISPFDAQSRRHTAFAGVDVIPEVGEAEDVEIRTEDLRIDTFRSSGAGGQHVNTTDSAVRITHLPTGVVVSCQAERSQIQNRARAMEMLNARLAQRAREERAAQLAEIRGETHEAAWGRQIRSYTMQPFQLVKDLRSGLEVGNIQAVLDGDFMPFVEAYLQWRRSEAGEMAD